MAQLRMSQPEKKTTDFEDWKNRLDRLMRNPENVRTSASSTSQKWHSSSTGCHWPVSTCCLAVWCPCVLFSRIHHRTWKNRTMNDFEVFNPTCLLWCGAAVLGVQWIPQFMQRADMRQKYNIEGHWISDLLCAFCCNCCDMIQQEKESEFREEALLLSTEQYSNRVQMQYSTHYPSSREQHQAHLLHPEPSVRTASSPKSWSSNPSSNSAPDPAHNQIQLTSPD